MELFWIELGSRLIKLALIGIGFWLIYQSARKW